MITFLIRNVQIDPLLSLLKDEYSDQLAKVWECGEMTNGVFIHTELAIRTMSDQAITIILQHYRGKHECEVTVVSSAGGQGLLHISLGSEIAAEATFRKRLEEISKIHEWKLFEKRSDRAGTMKCPFCGAFYVYMQNQVQSDNSVICQNCGKSFMFDKSKLEGPYLKELR